MTNKLFIFFTILITPLSCIVYFPNYNRSNIVFMFHGHGSSCDELQGKVNHMITEGHFDHVFCVQSGEVNDSVLASMNSQIINGATFILNVIRHPQYQEIAKQGIYFVGFSQGGIIARMIFNAVDEISELVTRMVTIGTPNIGIEKVEIFDSDFWNGCLNFVLGFNIVKNNVSAAFYANKNESAQLPNASFEFGDTFNYLNCAYLTQLNELYATTERSKNEIDTFANYSEYCAVIKNKYERLDLFVSIMYVNDVIIKPDNSPIFGQAYTGNNLQMVLQELNLQLQGKVNQQQQYLNLRQEIADAYRVINDNRLVDANKMVINRLNYLMGQIQIMRDDINVVTNRINDPENHQLYSRPLQHQSMRFYAQNVISLKTLIGQSKYLSCAVNYGHLQESIDDFDQIVVRPLSINLPKLRNPDSQEEVSRYYSRPFINPDDIAALKMYCDFNLLKEQPNTPLLEMPQVVSTLQQVKAQINRSKHANGQIYSGDVLNGFQKKSMATVNSKFLMPPTSAFQREVIMVESVPIRNQAIQQEHILNEGQPLQSVNINQRMGPATKLTSYHMMNDNQRMGPATKLTSNQMINDNQRMGPHTKLTPAHFLKHQSPNVKPKILI